MDGEKPKGVINVESSADNPFTEKDENLLTRLADLALIAIQNAEQYEEVEEEASTGSVAQGGFGDHQPTG